MMGSPRGFGLRTGCWLALSVAILGGWTSAAWAEDLFPLEKIELMDTGRGTQIVLHTGSIVPCRTLEASENRMVFDVTQVKPEATVQTDFSGAPNIRSVIMTPIGGSQVRVTIQGHDLGRPMVSFGETKRQVWSKQQAATLAARKAKIQPAPAAIDAVPIADTESFSGLALDETASQSVPPAESLTKSQASKTSLIAQGTANPLAAKTAPDILAAKSATTASEKAIIAPPPANPATNVQAPSTEAGFALSGLDEQTNSKPADEASAALPQPVSLPDAPDKDGNSPLGFLNPLIHSSGWWIPLAGVGGLMAALGMFLAWKFRQTGQESKHPKRNASAIQSFALSALDEMEAQPEESRPKRPGKARVAPSGEESPIGLGGLNRTIKPPAPTPAELKLAEELTQRALLEQAAAKRTIQTSAPARQAVNQYQRQQQPVGEKSKLNAGQLRQQAMVQQAQQARQAIEAQHASEVQRQLQVQPPQTSEKKPNPAMGPTPNAKGVSKPPQSAIQHALQAASVPRSQTVQAQRPGAPAKQKKPNRPPQQHQQEGLTNNTEVLDFLRSVADLMEKDGNNTLASSIQRNLRRPNQPS